MVSMKILLCLRFLAILTVLLTFRKQITPKTPQKRKRQADLDLPQYLIRRRKRWTPLKNSLGPDVFKIHHRITEQLFAKIHTKIRSRIYTDPKYVRQTCCVGNVSHVDTRSRLSMTLQHLGGSRTCDIAHIHGVSRPTVSQAIHMTFDAILTEYSIPPFPFHNERELSKIETTFKTKSTA